MEKTSLRRGVVAVIVRDGSLLAIRRAAGVLAPGAICFPGGGIEPGETEVEAVIRELQEELGIRVVPIRRLLETRTSWNAELAWWHCELPEPATLAPNAREVAEAFWKTPGELLGDRDLLPSNVAVLMSLMRGELPLVGGQA